LPGNVGLYQGAALGALAMAGHGGTSAAAASVFTPAAGSLATALAAMVRAARRPRDRLGSSGRPGLLRPPPRRAAPRSRQVLAQLRRIGELAVAADVAVLRADDEHHERLPPHRTAPRSG